MKTKEELNELREEYENPNKKLAELNEDELTQIAGGSYDSDVKEYFEGILNPSWAYATSEKRHQDT